MRLLKRVERTKGRMTSVKIAVTYENGQVFQHFGHCENFKIYEAEGQAVTSQTVVSAQGTGHGALAGFLKGLGVDTLICGGIGGGARAALAEAGIALYPGVTGEADASVTELLAGTLRFQPDVVCEHHHHGHREGHSCGGHSCGEHGCGGHH